MSGLRHVEIEVGEIWEIALSLDWAIEYGGHAQRKSTDPIRRSAEIDDPKRETVSMLDGICPPNTMLSRVAVLRGDTSRCNR